MYIYVYICIYIHHTHTHIYIYIHTRKSSSQSTTYMPSNSFTTWRQLLSCSRPPPPWRLRCQGAKAIYAYVYMYVYHIYKEVGWEGGREGGREGCVYEYTIYTKYIYVYIPYMPYIYTHIYHTYTHRYIDRYAETAHKAQFSRARAPLPSGANLVLVHGNRRSGDRSTKVRTIYLYVYTISTV